MTISVDFLVPLWPADHIAGSLPRDAYGTPVDAAGRAVNRWYLGSEGR
jgi:hypothetical protein